MSPEDQITLAASLLRRGEIIAFPTETVYGLGAKISDERAIKKIYEIKGRPADNPLIVHIGDLAHVELLAEDIPDDFFLLQKRFFPGPLTVILKRRGEITPLVSAGLPTIALRMPSHPVARALLQELGEPIAAPSANLSGKPSPTTIEHVREDFEGKIPLILDGGPCQFGIESTVISLIHREPTLLRPGSITKEAIEDTLGKKVALPQAKEPRYSPGMKYRHYAPRAKIRIFPDVNEMEGYLQTKIARPPMVLANLATYLPLSAQTLYAHFRKADQKGFDEICILCDAETQNDAGLMNRILTAAKGS
jgi:L-threonylcarbamoyladenylate synthase